MKIKNNIIFLTIIILLIAFNNSCKSLFEQKNYFTKNVIIIVIDGARYSETWGDETHKNIPFFAENIADEGVVKLNFYNKGLTSTVPGHTAMTTGVFQDINNSGSEFPANPSIFQYFLKEHPEDSLKSYIVTSKDKLEVLSNCTDSVWKDSYIPATNCGINGLGSGYRHDTITCKIALEIMQEHMPNLLLINFREPDFSAHKGNWDNYIKGLKLADSLSYEIWKFIQSDEYYKDQTTLFITNDHGRHSNGVSNGFISHGDNCEGCRHIFFYAYGPDFNESTIDLRERNLTDISKTVSELLNFEMPSSNGVVMEELFE